MKYGHWQYHEDFDINDYEGMIYKITLPNGKFYCGRKCFFNKVTKKPLKNMKRKRTSWVESDWKFYTGSSNELNVLLSQLDAFNVRFEILRLCENKSQMSYFEVYWIMMTGSMTDPLGLNKNCSRVPCRPKIK